MAHVQQGIARLDGVLSVSAGWFSDSAAIRTKAGVELTVEDIDRVVGLPFRVTSLTKE